MCHFAKKCPRKASVHLNYRGPGAMSEFKIGFVQIERQQASKGDQLTYGSSRGSRNEWPKPDADVDSNTPWEQEQVLSILERRPRGTREQPQAHVEQVGMSHDIYGPRGVVVDACIGRTQVEVLLDTRATTDSFVQM